jgi:ribosomal protein S12 methylthiotransferase accessory factor
MDMGSSSHAASESAAWEPRSHTPPSLLISGIAADSALGQALTGAFGASVRVLPDLFAADLRSSADLAICVHHEGDHHTADTFEAWALSVRVPALRVRLGASEAIIGPLALPGRAGCGYCARARMAAAVAAADGLADQQVLAGAAHDVSAAVGAMLVSEIAAIVGGSAVESRLLDHVLVCDARSGGTSLHRVIPLSRCPVCGGAADWGAAPARPTRLSAEDSPESVLAALAGWVDPRTGLISRIALELSGEAHAEPPIIATASPPYVVGEGGALRRLPIGWGKGMTLSGALLSAIGEAIERYAPSLPDPDRIVWARPDDLDGAFLDPRDFALYSNAQYEREGFPFRRFDPNVRHPWVLGRWLGSEAPVWVPAVFAFLSLTLRPEHQICQGTSNGLAASMDPEDAALRATLELIERDAFMAAWLTGRPGRRVELDGALDPQLARVLAGVEALGAEVELLVLPDSACGTAALCLAFGDGDRYPGVTIGLGADLDPLAAVRQAILELAQTGPHLRRLMRARALPVPEHPGDVREMIQHAVYYFPRERAAAFDRLRHGATPVALRELAPGNRQRSLASCAAALAAANIRVALVDVTSPDVATGPFRVIRAISPDLQAISYGHGLDHPPVERIRIRGSASPAPPIHPLW